MSYEEQPDDGLTDEERAALAAGEGSDDDQAPTSEGEEDVDASQQQPEAAAEDQPTGEGEPAADAVAAAGADDAQQAAAADPVTEPVAKAEPAAPQVAPAPILVVQAPEDAEAKLAEIASKKEALADQYEAGEITLKEMQKQSDALSEQAIDIRMAQREVELANKMEQQRIQQIWIADCNAFIAHHPEYADKDTPERKLMDETLMTLANMPTNRGLSNQEALARAHAIVQVQLGKPIAPSKPASAKTAAPPQVKKPEIPPDIGKLPAAAMNDTTGGEFAALESLRKSGNVEAYEDALSSLSDAARARYLRA